MNTLNLILSLCFGLSIGATLTWVVLREKLARTELALQSDVVRLTTTLEAERSQSEISMDVLEKARKDLKLEFENLANKALEDNSKKFSNENQVRLTALLNPLQDKIQSFEKRVNQTAKDGSIDSAKLREKLDGMASLNQILAQEANDLTAALKGQSKTRGNWGEVQLARVLEMSGLEEGISYSQQVRGTTADGSTRQPDVVIHLPDQRSVIVDSKVSLIAYNDYCAADEKAEKAKQLKAHVAATKLHIKQLSEKNYPSLDSVVSLDAVLMFVPIEPAYLCAIAEDPEIFAYAQGRNVHVVTPSTLIMTLRTIENMWRLESQNKNAQQIADLAGSMFDKFVAFTDDMVRLDKNLKTVRVTYDKAFNKLSSGTGNLVKRSEDLKKLGAKTSKSLATELVQKEFEEE